MLKEVAMLIFVLGCTQAFPTTTTPIKYKPTLYWIYCDAESLFGDYEKGKHFPREMRRTTEQQVLLPNCNFTKAPAEEEKCEIIQAYHELFVRLNRTQRDDGLLKPLMANHSLSSIVQYQGSYLKSHCPVAEITQIKYSNSIHDPSRENNFYYIFEQYKYCTLNLLRPELTRDVDESNLCGHKE